MAPAKRPWQPTPPTREEKRAILAHFFASRTPKDMAKNPDKDDDIMSSAVSTMAGDQALPSASSFGLDEATGLSLIHI